MATVPQIFVSFILLFSKCLSQYQTPAPEWDILNQHTFDGWDWFLYIFCFCCAGCLCFAAGWIWHGRHVKNLIVKDVDVLEYSTPIPNTPLHKGKTDYPEFPESAWEQKSPTEKKPYTAPQIVVTDTNGQQHELDKRQLGHLPQLSLHAAVSENKVLTYKTKNATILMMPMESKKSPQKKENIPSKRTERNNSMPHVKLQNISIPNMKKEGGLKEMNEDIDESETEVPDWKNQQIGRSETIKDIKSPDANEESESHLSMDMYMRQSSQHPGDVLTPNTPEQVKDKKDNSPYGDLVVTNLSPVCEEKSSSKSLKNKLKKMMSYSSASRHDRVESNEVDMENLDMNAGNKMVYMDYGDENEEEDKKSPSPQMLDTMTPPTQVSEHGLELGFQNSTRL